MVSLFSNSSIFIIIRGLWDGIGNYTRIALIAYKLRPADQNGCTPGSANRCKIQPLPLQKRDVLFEKTKKNNRITHPFIDLIAYKFVVTKVVPPNLYI